MHPDSEARSEALRLVRRGAAASLIGGLAYAGWRAAGTLARIDGVRERFGRTVRSAVPEHSFEEPVAETRPIDEAVRRLTDGLLSQTEDYGALALRAQLLRAVTTDAPTGAADPIDFATFTVPDDVPLAVPAAAEFPVRARFVGPGGGAYVVSLQVDEGLLGYLHLGAIDDSGERGFPDGDVRAWPSADEVTWWMDTIKGPEPVLR